MTKRGPSIAPRYRVLVVDDDAWMVKVIEAALDGEMEVVTSSSGELALRVLENEDFHVVCADYRMSGMNGLELLARAARLRPHIGGVIVTAADAQLLSEQRKDYYVLTKPFDSARLMGVVKQLARVAEMKRSVEAGSRPSSPPSSARPNPPTSSARPNPPTSSRASAPPSAPRPSATPAPRPSAPRGPAPPSAPRPTAPRASAPPYAPRPTAPRASAPPYAPRPSVQPSPPRPSPPRPSSPPTVRPPPPASPGRRR